MTIAMAAVVSVAMPGCSDRDVPRTENPGASVTAEAGSTSAIDPQARPAVGAYESFWKASAAALRAPVAFNAKLPPDADFTRYSWDPARTTYRGYVAGLAEDGVAFRGTPPEPRLRVESVDLEAKPYPVVTLKDCQTPAPDWQSYVVRTGERAPEATQSPPPPYEITAKMIFYQNRWGLQDTSTDTSRTCTR